MNPFRPFLFGFAVAGLTLASAAGAPLQQPTYIKSNAPHNREQFGRSVFYEDDLLVVGAPGNNQDPGGTVLAPGFFDSGAVFFFSWTGSEWVESGWMKSPTVEVGGRFGTAVHLASNRLFVSATGEPVAPEKGSPLGVVHVFENSSGSWVPEARLSANNASSEDRFGWTLDVHGNRLVVGASGERSESNVINTNEGDNTSSLVGAAYVFERTPSGWIQDAYLKASNSGEGDRFGSAVAIHGDFVVVGAPFESSNSAGIGPSTFNNQSTWS